MEIIIEHHTPGRKKSTYHKCVTPSESEVRKWERKQQTLAKYEKIRSEEEKVAEQRRAPGARGGDEQ